LNCIATAESSSQGRQPIKDIEITGLYSISNDELLNLLNIKQGVPLDIAAISRGIKRAFLKGIFDDLIIESSDTENTHIKILVKEKKIIDAIKIYGNDHFSQGFIKKQLSFHSDDRVIIERLRESMEKIRSALSKRGFPASEVSYEIRPEQRNKATVLITLKEGDPEIIRSIEIVERGDEIKSSLRLKEGDIYNQTDVATFVENIRTKLTKQGYVMTSLNHTFKNGTLSFTFEKGKKLTVSFEGNAALSTGALTKELTFKEINDFSDDLIDEAIMRMITLYHQKGFAFAKIVPHVKTVADEISLEFSVNEGDQLQVGSLRFVGTSLPQDRLMETLALKVGELYDPDYLESDKDALLEFYQALGYLSVAIPDAEVKVEDKVVSVLYDITEGTQVKIEKVTINNNKTISEETLLPLARIKKGDPYNEIDILDAKKRILDLYQKRGFLDARVSFESEMRESAAYIIFNVQEGDRTFFGHSIIVGNYKTKRFVITREFLHKEGAPFDYSLLFEERGKLLRTGLFSDVEIVADDRVNDQRDIIYRLKESDAGAVEFGVGYGDFDKFRGFLDLSYKNLWGVGRQASFRTELSTLDQRVILSYVDPWFLPKDVPLKAFFLFENKKELNFDTGQILYKLTRYSANVGTETNLTKKIKAELFYEFSVVNTYDIQPDVVLSKEDTGSLIISGLRGGLIYDNRDNVFTPRAGELLGVALKVTSKIFFSQSDFAKLTLSANKYLSLSKIMVLAVSIRGGLAQGYNGTDELPIVERFFLGGGTTVRGYKEDSLGPQGSDGNPTGGNAFAMGNIELRTDVGKGFGLVNFLDMGNVWQKINEVEIRQIKFTTGLGLRYFTPVGPLRVDYGFKLNRDYGESKGTFHFSIGHAF